MLADMMRSAIVLLGIWEVAKGGNLCESGGLYIIRIGDVNLEGQV